MALLKLTMVLMLTLTLTMMMKFCGDSFCNCKTLHMNQ